MIRNVTWDVFSITDPYSKEKKWDLLIHQCRFTSGCVKRHVKSLRKGYKAYKDMSRNLTWSVAYLRSTFSYTLLQKVPKLVLLTSTGPRIYVATIIAILS